MGEADDAGLPCFSQKRIPGPEYNRPRADHTHLGGKCGAPQERECFVSGRFKRYADLELFRGVRSSSGGGILARQRRSPAQKTGELLGIVEREKVCKTAGEKRRKQGGETQEADLKIGHYMSSESSSRVHPLWQRL